MAEQKGGGEEREIGRDGVRALHVKALCFLCPVRFAGSVTLDRSLGFSALRFYDLYNEESDDSPSDTRFTRGLNELMEVNTLCERGRVG